MPSVGKLGGDRDRLAVAARNLAVDAVIEEAVVALRAASVPCLLLKGPATVRRLYGHSAARSYVDGDLLVRHGDLPAAERVMERLGFTGPASDRDVPEWHLHAHPWTRARDRGSIDLHWTLTGIEAEPDAVWRAATRELEAVVVGRAEVDAPGRAFTGLMLALHVAAHGGRSSQAVRDLERAIQELDHANWAASGSLALELDALPAFATGLRMLPSGRALGRRLNLPVAAWMGAVFHDSIPRGASRFERLARARGPWAKATLVAGTLFPSPAFMRELTPLARRGPLGLAAAYLLRPVDLLFRTTSAWRAWRRARHLSGSI